MEEAWRVLFGTMAPWEVAELGCLFQYICERYSSPYNEIAESLAQYGQAEIYTLSEEQVPQVPVGSIQLDASDLKSFGDERLQSLASMGPTPLYNFLPHKNTHLDRPDWIFANARGTNWSIADICPMIQGCFPLLYPADRFNFGEDFDGLKRLLASLPPPEGPNILCDRYLLWFPDSADAFEELFYTNLGISVWRSGYALWGDERVLEWDAPMDYETAFGLR